MRALHLPSRLPRRLTWLLWLALLLPMAQSTATWHAFSHLGSAANSHVDDKRSLHATHCDLCLNAASVSGGALPGAPARVPQALAQHEPPQDPARSVWPTFPPLAYLSRAPPLAWL